MLEEIIGEISDLLGPNLTVAFTGDDLDSITVLALPQDVDPVLRLPRSPV